MHASDKILCNEQAESFSFVFIFKISKLIRIQIQENKYVTVMLTTRLELQLTMLSIILDT